jgi:hypothetical protein
LAELTNSATLYQAVILSGCVIVEQVITEWVYYTLSRYCKKREWGIVKQVLIVERVFYTVGIKSGSGYLHIEWVLKAGAGCYILGWQNGAKVLLEDVGRVSDKDVASTCVLHPRIMSCPYFGVRRRTGD